MLGTSLGPLAVCAKHTQESMWHCLLGFFALFGSVRDSCLTILWTWFDNSKGFQQQEVGKLSKEVEPEGGPGAWNEFAPICSCQPMHMRMHWSPSPCQFSCLVGAVRDSSWTISFRRCVPLLSLAGLPFIGRHNELDRWFTPKT
jgi:hypothetical protein